MKQLVFAAGLACVLFYACAVSAETVAGTPILLKAPDFVRASANPSLTVMSHNDVSVPVWSLSGGTPGQSVVALVTNLPACDLVRIEALVTTEDRSTSSAFEDVYRVTLAQLGATGTIRSVRAAPVRTALPDGPLQTRWITLESGCQILPSLPLSVRIAREPDDPSDSFTRPAGLLAVRVTPLKTPPPAYLVENRKVGKNGYNSWPMIQALGNRLVCAYSRGSAHTIGEGARGVFARVSEDGGRSWSEESVIADDPSVGEVTVGKGLDEKGAMLLWVRRSGHGVPAHDLYRTTNGLSWTRVATPALSETNWTMQITDVIRIPGTGLMSLWFGGDYNNPTNHWWGTLVSHDNGATWTQKVVECGLPKEAWPTEPSAVWLGNGRILGIARTELGESSTRRAQFQLESDDAGKTWRRTRTNIGEVSASTPSLMLDESTGLLSVYYYERGRGVIRRRVVRPEAVFGRSLTWPASEVVALGSDAAHHAGNVNVTALGGRHYISYYSGTESETAVLVAETPAPKARSFSVRDPNVHQKTVRRRVAPVSVTTNGFGSIVVDFGREAFGFLEFLPPPGTTGSYEVRLGELLTPDGRVNMKPGATIRAARVTNVISGSGVHRVPLVPDKRNTSVAREGAAILIPPEHGVVMPFRYAEIVTAPFPIRKDTLRMTAVNYPMDLSQSSFVCSDSRLNKVYDFCKYSVLATSFAGLYVDGDRERIPYEGDAYINQLSEYAVHADYSLARASHIYLMTHSTWPTEWKQHSIKIAWADWMWTGDARALVKYYDQLKKEKLMAAFARTSDGLLLTGGERGKGARPGASDIVDWPPCERDGFVFRPVNAVVNAFYYRNLLEMADLAKALGKTDESAHFTSGAARVKTAFNKVFRLPARHIYCDGEGTEHASLHANAAALAFGLVSSNDVRSVTDFCVTRGMACSVYFSQYLLEALFEGGRADAALALMTADTDRSWLGMLRQGATITMEAWAPKYKPNLDLNHAWGTPPLNIISRYVLGVTPLEPGFRLIGIRPNVGSLRHAEGTVPTVKGPVSVRVAESVLTVTIPAGARARVEFAGKVQTVGPGTHTMR